MSFLQDPSPPPDPSVPEGHGPLLGGVVDLTLPSGRVVRILPRQRSRKPFRILHDSVQRASTAPARVLVRKIERLGDSGWDFAGYDVVVSPHDSLTLSIWGDYSLVETLLAEAIPMDWPAWVPNDEAAEPLPGPTPPLEHPEVWEAVVEVIEDTFGLEEDQVFWDLDLDLLEGDSLDAVEIIMSLEERLDIEIPDAEAEKLPFQDATLGEFYETLVELLEK